MFNDANERLGSAVQWTDRTEEHRAEQEVSQLVQAAAAGDFSKRVEEAGKEGFFLRLAKDLNSLVDTADRGLRDVSRMLGALAPVSYTHLDVYKRQLQEGASGQKVGERGYFAGWNEATRVRPRNRHRWSGWPR